MNRNTPPVSKRPVMLIEALEPRIAPAALVNGAKLNETKFTSVTVGGSILLDASGGPGEFQGLSTAFGAYSGSYLLYLVQGKALVFTTDLNGNGVLDPGEITGIALGKDSQGRAPELLLFSDVHGDIVTNLQSNNVLTDSDGIPANGRDGRVLLDTPIAGITLRTLTAADIDQTVPGNTVAARLALTHFSVYGNIYSGGDFGGLSIDTSGEAALAAKFNAAINPQSYTGSQITIGSIDTGTAANNQYYHFTQAAPTVLAGSTTTSTELVSNNIAEGMILPFHVPAGEHGGDISNVSAVDTGTVFSIGTLATGDGGIGTGSTGDAGARGGNISAVTLHGATGSYSLIAGNGGIGFNGGQGGSILQFSDLSTDTGQVILHSGDGGRGVLGKGGDGGTATLATTNISADLQIVLGAGGAGLTQGGDGASITNTVITAPDVARPIGSKVTSTWHDIGDVGDTHPISGGNTTGNQTYSAEAIDFDGDGIGDLVYTNTAPDQVVVEFGDGFGSVDASKTVILKTPGIVNPVVTVGDFNGDGKPDIAVASGGTNNFGGVEIFLDQIGNNTLDPVSGSNYTHNVLGDHPFSNAEHSAVPILTNLGYVGEAGAIVGLAAGDFNGDGITDIAYTQIVRTQGNLVSGEITGILFGEQATSLNTDTNIVGAHLPTTFVNGSLDNGLVNNTTGRPQGTGFFYSNTAPTGSATGIQVSTFLQTTATPIMHATSLTANNVPTLATGGRPLQPEVVAVSPQGAQDVQVYTAAAPNAITHIPTPIIQTNFGPELTVAGNLDDTRMFHLGQVDTNRALSSASPFVPQVALQDFILQDFTIADVDQDGRPDIITLSSAPQTFLDAYRGNAAGGFTRASVNNQALPGAAGDNNGIYLGDNHPASIAITVSDPTQTGRFDGFALVNLQTTPGPATVIQELRLIPATTLLGNQTALTNDPLGFDTVPTNTTFNGITEILTIDRQVNTIDSYYTNVAVFDRSTNTPVANPVTGAVNLFPDRGYALLAPDTSVTLDLGLFLLTQGGNLQNGSLTKITGDGIYLTSNGINIFSGNGGNSSNGAGGNGGLIGNGTLNVGTDLTTTASIQLRYTPNQEYNGLSVLQAGQGGNGATTGGVGGSIEGASARYNPTTGDDAGLTGTYLTAGDGGNGIAGNGGDGGQISSVSIETGPSFLSGNGGSGLKGGNGGAITGNSVTYDTLVNGVQLLTGTGGQGLLGGGTGGTINKWSSEINGYTGSVFYTAGSGGSAAGGTGGAGGAITNSPLSNEIDLLGGALQLTSGTGGDGLNGGAGGAITNFTNPATDPLAIASTLTVIGGKGGIGISGVGGAGGSISGLQSNTVGISTVDPVTGQYNGLARIIAGDGGTSFGGTGGDGGSLTSINATATSTPLVAAAGAGGDGLTAGGLGGSVGSSDTTTFLNSASQQVGKLLIVAGKGGDAYAAQAKDIFLPNDNDTSDLAHAVLAFGGTTGVGGNGGNVVNVQQPSSTQTSVDIIAGNGGNTPNAGSATTLTTTVGRGGSISDVFVAGTIGTISRDNTQGALANPPIKSYSATDTITGTATTSLTQFVDFLASDDSLTFRLDDSAGNVGMVAGAAGTVRGAQPAQDGVNGSVAGLTASSILSIVAGSVDRVVPVASLSGVVLTSPDGVLGADKSVNSPFGPNGVLDYYNAAGQDVPTLEPGGRLIDGAIFAQSIISTANLPITGPRVFGPQA